MAIKKDRQQRIKIASRQNTYQKKKRFSKIEEKLNKYFSAEFKVLDARSKEDSKVKRTKSGLRSGSIPNSTCLPFNQLLQE